ncbi:MAG: LutC/YkgG family protein [Hyphomicrobiaceae bacterium]
MNPRDAILGKVRTGLGVSADDAERRAAVADRIAMPPRHLIPARAAGKSTERLKALFRGFLEGQSATVVEVARRDDIPAAITAYLRSANLPSRVRAGSDPYLAAVAWSNEPALQVLSGPALPTDEAGLSHAIAGVAETGTLLVASGPDNPVTLNFLPETHIVAIEQADLTGPYEDAWSKVRARFGPAVLPRTINMISGPSRTGDIGGKLVMGAHGPRRMCVIIVND